MTKIVATHKVVNLEKWKALESERREKIGALASEIFGYVDPNGGDTVAVTIPKGFRHFPSPTLAQPSWSGMASSTQ